MKFPERSQLAESYKVHVLLSGGNGADLVLEEGLGATLTAPRSNEGAYTLTIGGANPGTFKGWRWAFGAATPADCAGYTAVRDTPVAWNGTSWTMPFVVYNSSFAAADLLVNQYIDIELVFGISE
jgi:hypothetical protein